MKRLFLLLAITIAAYANAQTYQIGDLIEFPDKTFGVVFYLNQQTGDGLVVSMDEIETHWEAADDEEDKEHAFNVYTIKKKKKYSDDKNSEQGVRAVRHFKL